MQTLGALEGLILFLDLFFLFVNAALLSLVFTTEKRNRKKIHIVFGLFVAAVIVWDFFEYAANFTSAFFPVYNIHLIRLTGLGPLYMPPFFILLAYLFPDKEEIPLKKWQKIALFLPAVVFTFAIPTSLTFKPIPPEQLTFWTNPEPGDLFDVYFVYFLAYIAGWGGRVLWKRMKKEQDAEIRRRMKVFFSGAVIGIGLLFLVDAVLFSLVTGSRLVDALTVIVVPVSSFVLTITAAYAVFKALNLRVVMAQFFSIFIVVLGFFNTYGGGIFGSSGFLRHIVFAGTAVFAVFLIRSVLQEVKQKEQIETLAKGLSKANGELADLNEHLEEKVKEQTIEIRKAYEVEKKAKEELLALDKAKTDFILTTQHHLRTPLTIARTVFTSLKPKKEGEVLSATDVSFVEKGATATDTLAKLVNDFLDISQMEVGKSILQKKQTSVHPLVTEVVEELSPVLKEKDLKVSASFSPEAKETTVYIDPKRFREAVFNVLNNAATYTPANGSITVTGSIGTHPIERTKFYRLEIKDSGIGMTDEEQKAVFTQVFQRGERAKEMYATGRGIGLMLTKQIVEAHGGMIRAVSEGKDKGAAFVLELPIGEERN